MKSAWAIGNTISKEGGEGEGGKKGEKKGGGRKGRGHWRARFTNALHSLPSKTRITVYIHQNVVSLGGERRGEFFNLSISLNQKQA